ncbi:MAG TPA: acyl carrier protein [Solimonas sp.]|nr:acyl carrier protein [Solimonas sp.]
MKGSQDPAFKLQLKELVLREADKQADPAAIDDDAPLFGPRSALQLDSVDALQISMALQLRYNWKVTDPKEARRLLVSINVLADHLQPA